MPYPTIPGITRSMKESFKRTLWNFGVYSYDFKQDKNRLTPDEMRIALASTWNEFSRKPGPVRSSFLNLFRKEIKYAGWTVSPNPIVKRGPYSKYA